LEEIFELENTLITNHLVAQIFSGLPKAAAS
jgi:hypothetical protein